jgi:hypothetical protein
MSGQILVIWFRSRWGKLLVTLSVVYTVTKPILKGHPQETLSVVYTVTKPILKGHPQETLSVVYTVTKPMFI